MIHRDLASILPPDKLGELSSGVATFDRTEHELAAMDARLARVAALTDSLKARMGEIEAELATPLLSPDPDRVEMLLAGASPAAEGADGFSRFKARRAALDAELAQLRADLAAVEETAARDAAARQDLARRLRMEKMELFNALGAALVQSYREAMLDIIRGRVRAMHALYVAMRREFGGERAGLEHHLEGIEVSWPGQDRARAWLWSGFGDHLLTGEPKHAPEMVPALLDLLREVGSTGAGVAIGNDAKAPAA